MSNQIPPWLQEQIKAYQQTQGNLQGMMAQMQQVEAERLDAERAIEELQKASDEHIVYKQAGSILIKSDRKTLTDDLEERQELAKTRVMVLEKQKKRLEETLREQEAKINAAIKGGAAGPPGN